MNQKHLLQMLAICAAIIVMGIAMIALFKVSGNSALFLGLLILCPLSHILMMRTMGNNADMTHDSAQHDHSKDMVTYKEKSNVQNCH